MIKPLIMQLFTYLSKCHPTGGQPLAGKIFGLCLLLLWSCDNFKSFRGGINEGVIVYNVTFPSLDPESLTASMMPDEITKIFKGHLTRIEMNVGHGLMKTAYISNSKNHSMIILLELFGAKYAAMQKEESNNEIMKQMPTFELEHVDEAKIIADYACKKVVVKDPESDRTFDIYYTESIYGDDMNWDTPFREVEGMILVYPMAYRFADETLEMNLIASKVEPGKVSDRLFKIPRDHEMVDKSRIDRRLEDLMVMGRD